MRRSFLRLTTLFAATAGAASALRAQESGKPLRAPESGTPLRVVVQVSEADPARWNLALNNVQNLQEELGAAQVAVEIVAYGPGIGMLRLEAPTNSRISDAVKNGVAVNACENTMRNQKLARADMHPAVGYVPAGVVEIVRRQHEGWAYLRP